ncbi:MAG TPA: YbaB/EbfC family nucleoid-associated protein [Acidimicrobiales bacterium]|jgi:DNA-binding YbaB/EbfC family protein|nr:YbaB/EbfC family nucleoid-associated protein [Acidimicrobiales bacterium]
MSDAPKTPSGDDPADEPTAPTGAGEQAEAGTGDSMTDDDDVVVAEVEVTEVEVAGDPSAGFPGLPGLGDVGAIGGLEGLLESAQEALSAQAAAAEEVIEGTAGGGVVVAEMSGAGEVLSLKISPEVVDPDDVEMLQDLVVAALHDAAGKVTALQRQALGAFGGMDLGGLGGFGDTGGG